MFSVLFVVAAVIFSFVTALFLVSVIVKRNDIADIAWGIGILLAAATSYLLSAEKSLLMNLLLLLLALWSLRLSIRIFLRNINKEEDYRYKKWRDDWGKWFYLRSYFQVYLLQGFLMIVVGYSAIHASLYSSGNSIGILTLVGVGVWSIGYFFEVMGDLQLGRFIKSKPQAGVVLSTGLWKYTRHPNYFGEVTMWWGLWLMVATLPLSYIALISPLTITYLILKVSGIPMLEKRFEGNSNFETYKKRTSAFFPLPPKNI
jgi:steroid 5-alpha reductase family enzyme